MAGEYDLIGRTAVRVQLTMEHVNLSIQVGVLQVTRTRGGGEKKERDPGNGKGGWKEGKPSSVRRYCAARFYTVAGYGSYSRV